VYPLDDLGYNSLEGEVQVPEGMEQAARWGADACPENAITIIE
jgi:ferredoxin